MKSEELEKLFKNLRKEKIQELTKIDAKKINEAPDKATAINHYFDEFHEEFNYNDKIGIFGQRDHYGEVFYREFVHFTKIQPDYIVAIDKAKEEVKILYESKDLDRKQWIFDLSYEDAIIRLALTAAYKYYFEKFHDIHSSELTFTENSSDRNIKGIKRDQDGKLLVREPVQAIDERFDNINPTDDNNNINSVSYLAVITALAGSKLIPEGMKDPLTKLLKPNTNYVDGKIDYMDYLWKLHLIITYLVDAQYLNISNSSKNAVAKYICSNFTYKKKKIKVGVLNDKILTAQNQHAGGSYTKFVSELNGCFKDLGVEIPSSNN